MIQLQIVRAGPTESSSFDREVVAELRVENGRPQIEGDRAALHLEREIMKLRDGSRVRFRDDPEEWARSLPGSLRGPNLSAVVLEDTDPIPEPEDDEEPVAAPRRVAHGAHSR